MKPAIDSAPWVGDHGDAAGLSTPLHEARLAAVIHALLASGARSVLDLGCGEGVLIARLAAQAQFRRIVGIDISPAALNAAREALHLDPLAPPGRVQVMQASFTDVDPGLRGFDAAVMLETIEHVDPANYLLEHGPSAASGKAANDPGEPDEPDAGGAPTSRAVA